MRSRKRPARTGRNAASHRGNRPARSPATSHTDAFEPPRVFRLGAVTGATPGKWIDTWNERMPHVPLELRPLEVGSQRDAVEVLDAAIVRLPVSGAADVHVITLYDETPVVVASTDSHLLAADELTTTDLDGEVLIVPADNSLPDLQIPGAIAPDFPQIATTADAIATVAAGVGIVVMPMSLARLHHRKDVDYRPLSDGPTSTVALVWMRDHTTRDVETFVGIVRGRTAASSR